MSSENAIEHQASVDMGLKIKIKRKNPPAKVQEQNKKPEEFCETEKETYLPNSVVNNTSEMTGVDSIENMESDNMMEEANMIQSFKSSGKCKSPDTTPKKSDKIRNTAGSNNEESVGKAQKKSNKRKRNKSRAHKDVDETNSLPAVTDESCTSEAMEIPDMEIPNVEAAEISVTFVMKDKAKSKKESKKRSVKSIVEEEGFPDVPVKLTRMDSPVEKGRSGLLESRAGSVDPDIAPASAPSSPNTVMYEYLSGPVNGSISDRMAVTRTRPDPSDHSLTVETREVGTDSYSEGVMTEPDCLGPCEPGSSVILEGIVWSESTNAGLLVVNVTWRQKTYVGTLMDSTRHDWGSPRFIDEAAELDWKMSKGRRGAPAPVSEVQEGGRRLRKCRRGAGAAAAAAKGTRSSPTLAEAGGRRKGPARSTDLENQQNKGSNKSSNSSGDEEVSNKTEATGTAGAGDYRLECKVDNCHKKYKQASGLLYHQTHAHRTPTVSQANQNASRPSSKSTTASETASLPLPTDVKKGEQMDEVSSGGIPDSGDQGGVQMDRISSDTNSSAPGIDSSSIAKINGEVITSSASKNSPSSDVTSCDNSVIRTCVTESEPVVITREIDGSAINQVSRSNQFVTSNPPNGFSVSQATIQSTSSSHNNAKLATDGSLASVMNDPVRGVPYTNECEIVHNQSFESHRNGLNGKVGLESKSSLGQLYNVLVKSEMIDDKAAIASKSQGNYMSESDFKGKLENGIHPKTEQLSNLSDTITRPAAHGLNRSGKAGSSTPGVNNSQPTISKVKACPDVSGLSSYEFYQPDPFTHQRNIYAQNMRAAEEFAARSVAAAAATAANQSQTFPHAMSPFGYPIEPAYHFHLMSVDAEYREQYSRWLLAQQQGYRYALDAASIDMTPVDMSSKAVSGGNRTGVTMASNIIQFGKTSNGCDTSKSYLGQGPTVANDAMQSRRSNANKLQATDDAMERFNSKRPPSNQRGSPHGSPAPRGVDPRNVRIAPHRTVASENSSVAQINGSSHINRSLNMSNFVDGNLPRDESLQNKIMRDNIARASEGLNRSTSSNHNSGLYDSRSMSNNTSSNHNSGVFDSRSHLQSSQSSNVARQPSGGSASISLATSPLSIYPPNIVPQTSFLNGIPIISSNAMESSYQALLGYANSGYPVSDALLGRSVSADGEKLMKKVPERPSSSSSAGKSSSMSSPSTRNGFTPLSMTSQSTHRPGSQPDKEVSHGKSRKEVGKSDGGEMGEERTSDDLNSSLTLQHLHNHLHTHVMESSYPLVSSYNTGLMPMMPTSIQSTAFLPK